MAGRVLCIELGSALTKVCDMDYGKTNPSVYESFMFQTPDGTMEDGYIRSTEQFKEEFKKELAARNITTDKLIFAIYSNKIATREAVIPTVKDAQIMSVIQSNASDYFPIDLTGYQLGYTILDRVNTKEEKTLKLSIVAAPKDMLDTYLALANALEMQLVDIDFAGNSIFQAIKDTSNTMQASIHMNEYSTLISIIDDGKMLMQRSIAYGVFGTIEAVQGLPEYNSNPSFSVMDAIEVLTNQTYIDPEFSQGDAYSAGMSSDSSASGSSRIVTDSLRYLVGNVARVIDYFLSKNQGAEIGELKLTGLGSQFKGINELFANEIGIKTRQIIAVPSVSFERVGSGSMLPVMLLAVGANLSPMGLVPEEVAKQKAATQSQGSFALGLMILALCLIGCAGLFILGKSRLMVANADLKHSSSVQESETYIYSVEADYNSVSQAYADFKVFYDDTDSVNKYLKDFIEEMEEKMPKDIKTLEVSATADGIDMSITVSSKAEVAYVISELRDFETIEIASVDTHEVAGEFETEEDEENGETTESKDSDETVAPLYEQGENVVTFDVSCVYATESETEEE